MFETGFYFASGYVAIAIAWLLLLVFARIKTRPNAARRLQAKIAFPALLLGLVAVGICYLNVYRDYGVASRAELPAAKQALADAKLAREAAAAKAMKDAEEVEAAEKKRLLAEAEKRRGLKVEEENRCGLYKIVGVSAEQELRTRADESSDRIKNEKASNSKFTFYQIIDPSETVRITACDGDWREVAIMEPSYLRDVGGWVPARVLTDSDLSINGPRMYKAADFYWDDDTSAYKDQLILAVNKIAKEREGCSKLDAASLARSPTQGSATDPVFFVTCGEPPTAFNVWFRLTDY
ncbi:hypothetical protein GUK30_32570 [Rhizobium leguminosarum]|uniref:hypothetical protein n=1 Tax=Rhizobium ruizarguesonis TaxID=2081791 RepID=UPI0013BEC481|nr:hypothetical protein [Rhizobium ruizarguesonis]NEI24082.1 hypothetical protein [Rhizobium ruizarguesonis]